MLIKDLIRLRRTALKLTLSDVAVHVGVSRATVSRWERGEIKNMGSDKIWKLAEILQIPPDDLISGAG